MANLNLSLRVDSDIRKIDVNDNGDCIEVNMSDIKLMEKIETFVSKLGSVKDFALNIGKEIGDVTVDVSELEDESIPIEDRQLKADAVIKELRSGARQELLDSIVALKCDFDTVFGVRAADKVFGNGSDITPNVAMYYNFLNKFIPVVSSIVKANSKSASMKSRTVPKRGGKR